MNIESVVTEALNAANMKVADVDAIAVTNRPGESYITKRGYQMVFLNLQYVQIHSSLVNIVLNTTD